MTRRTLADDTAGRMLTDEAFLILWSRAQDPLEFEVERGDDWAHVRWIMPTDTVPGPFRGFVGEQIALPVDARWQPAVGGRHTARLRIYVQARTDADLDATVTLSPGAAVGTNRLLVEGKFTVHVPLIGGRMEDLVQKELLKPLFQELCDLLAAHAKN